MPSVANEWRGYPTVRMVSFALYVGLLTGASFWGMSCDVVGYVFLCRGHHTQPLWTRLLTSNDSRRVAWNSTLLLSGVFGIIAGAMPNFISFVRLTPATSHCAIAREAERGWLTPIQSVMIALVGFGTGGNLPVDGTMFLEFIPGNKQYLLTFLSIWWAIGQVIASLVAVSFFLTCPLDPTRGLENRKSNLMDVAD